MHFICLKSFDISQKYVILSKLYPEKTGESLKRKFDHRLPKQLLELVTQRSITPKCTRFSINSLLNAAGVICRQTVSFIENKEGFIIQPKVQAVRFYACALFGPKAQLGLALYQDLLPIEALVICESFVLLSTIRTVMVDNSWTDYAPVNCNSAS